jgi:D-amino-acid dehydrogenase
MTSEAAKARVLLAIQEVDAPKALELPELVAYRPELDGDEPSTLARYLASLRPDIFVSRRYPSAAVGAAWREAVPEGTLLAIATDPDGPPEPELEHLKISCQCFNAPGGVVEPASVLAFAERACTRLRTCADLPEKLGAIRKRNGGGEVMLAGAGIVNLLTALHLQNEGYEVSVYDSRPDPRGAFAWNDYGCTRGGENARMFSLTEADDYHDKGRVQHRPANTIFGREISEGGWRICRAPSEADLEWVDDFRAVAPWLAQAYTNDMVDFTREGGAGWAELVESECTLFDDIELRRGILRLYTDRRRFLSEIARQDRVGATKRVLSVAEVADSHPALAKACNKGEVVGGIEVVGFTLPIHDLVERILIRVEQEGGTFHWNDRVEGIAKRPSGTVEGLIVGGEPVKADHYVLSPGAYGGDLLRGTASEDLIHGVLGVWLPLPNVAPRLECSLKIARSGHLAEDSNVTVGRNGDGEPALVLGSGYGWTGADPTNIDPVQFGVLYQAVADTARRFFPDPYAAARESGVLDGDLRFCVRPWTASNLPLFEIQNTCTGGALVITGGHNTGGFAQAPAVATAVGAALRGEPHPMHFLYDPRRLRSFTNGLGTSAGVIG